VPFRFSIALAPHKPSLPPLAYYVVSVTNKVDALPRDSITDMVSVESLLRPQIFIQAAVDHEIACVLGLAVRRSAKALAQLRLWRTNDDEHP